MWRVFAAVATCEEISMKLLLTWVRPVAACGILTFSLVFPAALPASAERPSDAGQLLLWLLSLNTAREPEDRRQLGDR